MYLTLNKQIPQISKIRTFFTHKIMLIFSQVRKKNCMINRYIDYDIVANFHIPLGEGLILVSRFDNGIDIKIAV